MSNVMIPISERVNLDGDIFEVDFEVFNQEQVHIKAIYVDEREISAHLRQETKDEIQAYLMHHHTNHVA